MQGDGNMIPFVSGLVPKVVVGLYMQVAGWPVSFLVSGLAVVERVRCLFGSCGWAAGVHALATRLEPITIEAWRDLDLVTIDGWVSLLGCWLEPA